MAQHKRKGRLNMLNEFELWHALAILLAALLDVIANIFIKMSEGFKHIGYGVLSVLFVCAAFTSLAYALKGIELSIAYTLWGALGVMATAIIGMVLFNQRLNYKGWLGLGLLTIGMTMIKMA